MCHYVAREEFCGLRHLRKPLLTQGRVAEAATLARRHSQAPHFARSLEWLLFTALEFNADAALPLPAAAQPLAPQWASPAAPERRRRANVAGPLLLAAANLIRQFPQARLQSTIVRSGCRLGIGGSARST